MIDLTDIDLAELRLQADKIELAGGNAQVLYVLINAYEDLPGVRSDLEDAERSLTESQRDIEALERAARAPLKVKKYVRLPSVHASKQTISAEFIKMLRDDLRTLASAHPEKGYLNHAVDEFWDSYATLYSRANRKAATP